MQPNPYLYAANGTTYGTLNDHSPTANYALSANMFEEIAAPVKPKKSRRKAKHMSVEEMYAKLTAEGVKCRIVRKKGKPPQILILT